MKRAFNLSVYVSLLLTPALYAAKALAEDNDEAADPFAFFLEEPLPLELSHSLDHRGLVEVGAAYTSQDNVHFGRYNGLDEEGFNLILNARLQAWEEGGSGYWGLRADDLGLDSREASFWWGELEDFRLQLDYAELTQINGRDNTSPFLGVGSSYLWLPANWVAASTTANMTELDASAGKFEQKVEREQLAIRFRKRFSERWSMDTSAQREEKNGLEAAGAAFYLDASNPHAVILPQPIDSTTDAINLAAQYGGDSSHWQLGYLYSSYDNHEAILQWQNPYNSNYGAGFDYPDGVGGLGQAPDNELHQLRVIGNYQFASSLQAQLDAAYNHATQDQSFQAYSVNPAATVLRGLPRSSLQGEVNSTTVNATLISNAIDKLTLQARYRYQDRDNKTPRDGYLYVRGDSGVQPDAALTIYNRPTSSTKNNLRLEGSYRFPKRTRLTLGYEFEEINRYNMAVNRTREDTWDAVLRLQPADNLYTRFQLAWSDRAASTYNWDQAYYALLDPELINATPQSQRYNNHPLLSQYFLANRERLLSKINLNWVQSAQWQHNLDLLWSGDDYDETELGLTKEDHFNITLSSSYAPLEALTMTAYYSFDQYTAEQMGRAFSGGIEKNAFVAIPPYPQASDPERDWLVQPDDIANAFGFNLNWIARRNVLDLDLDYSFVDTRAKQDYQTYGALGLAGVALPDNTSRMHHLNAVANWYLRSDVTLKFNYQYYRFRESNWANNDVTADTLAKVLGINEFDANENVNFVGLSMLVYLP